MKCSWNFEYCNRYAVVISWYTNDNIDQLSCVGIFFAKEYSVAVCNTAANVIVCEWKQAYSIKLQNTWR